jgi:hypothetical protein
MAEDRDELTRREIEARRQEAGAELARLSGAA